MDIPHLKKTEEQTLQINNEGQTNLDKKLKMTTMKRVVLVSQ